MNTVDPKLITINNILQIHSALFFLYDKELVYLFFYLFF